MAFRVGALETDTSFANALSLWTQSGPVEAIIWVEAPLPPRDGCIKRVNRITSGTTLSMAATADLHKAVAGARSTAPRRISSIMEPHRNPDTRLMFIRIPW